MTPERFGLYRERGGMSLDMISHYYDKLLYVALSALGDTTTTDGVWRNGYLEEKGRESMKDMVEVCVRFGRTGLVDVGYIEDLAAKVGD